MSGVFMTATGTEIGKTHISCAYLARHGVTATPIVLTDTERPVPEQVLEYARQTGAGLLVMGAYGHSRLRELVLGGVTRRMLIDAELPVLMAH